jgi:hypothetical protein
MVIAVDCVGAVCAGMVPALDFCCLSTLTTLPPIQCPREALSRAAMTFHSGPLLSLQASAFPIAHLFHEGFASRPLVAIAMTMTRLTYFGWTHHAASTLTSRALVLFPSSRWFRAACDPACLQSPGLVQALDAESRPELGAVAVRISVYRFWRSVIEHPWPIYDLVRTYSWPQRCLQYAEQHRTVWESANY